MKKKKSLKPLKRNGVNIKQGDVVTLFGTPLIVDSFDGWAVECHSPTDINAKYEIPLPFVDS